MINSEKFLLTHLDDAEGNNLLFLHLFANPIEYTFISSSSSFVEIKIVDCFNHASSFIEKHT